MQKTISLGFGKNGILNPSKLQQLTDNSDIENIVMFGDGSIEALEYIKAYSGHQLLSLPNIKRIGVGISPRYDMRVISENGDVSLPNYAYTEDVRIKWFCTNVASPLVQIDLSDITSQSSTQVRLNKEDRDQICYHAYLLWTLLLHVEARLAFPAVVIDRMTRWTYNLTEKTIDIALLRKETGIASLDYNPVTDLLSMSFGGDDYVIKLSVLNDVYGEIILPKFNKLLGRRLRLSVSITGSGGHTTEPVDMTYGELGRIIEDLRIYTKVRTIDVNNPIDANDLLEFLKVVEINDENCIWVEPGETLVSTIESKQESILFRNTSDDDFDEASTTGPDDSPEESITIHE